MQAILNEKQQGWSALRRAWSEQTRINALRMQRNVFIFIHTKKIQRSKDNHRYNRDKRVANKPFSMNYKQLSELETGQMQQFWFIDWKACERMREKKIDSTCEKGKRINLIYFRFMPFVPPSLCQKLFIINQFIIYRSSRCGLLAFANVVFFCFALFASIDGR